MLVCLRNFYWSFNECLCAEEIFSGVLIMLKPFRPFLFASFDAF